MTLQDPPFERSWAALIQAARASRFQESILDSQYEGLEGSISSGKFAVMSMSNHSESSIVTHSVPGQPEVFILSFRSEGPRKKISDQDLYQVEISRMPGSCRNKMMEE